VLDPILYDTHPGALLDDVNADIGERDVSDLKRLGLYNRIAAYMAEAVLQGDPLTVPEALRFAYLSPDDAVADRLALSRAEIDGLEAIVAAYLSGTWKAA